MNSGRACLGEAVKDRWRSVQLLQICSERSNLVGSAGLQRGLQMIRLHDSVHCGYFLTLVCYLLSVEQKNETQGLWVFLSEEGGRYMASEKQARSSFSSSVLNQQTQRGQQDSHTFCWDTNIHSR